MSLPRWRTFATCAALLLAPGLAAAQPASPPPPWSGDAGLSYVQTGGNSETKTVGLAAKGVRENAPWRFESRAAFLRTESTDLVTAKKWAALLRGERALGPRLSAFAQTTWLRDIFAGIKRESAVDAGALYKLLTGPRHLLSTSAALAFTDESRLPPAADRRFAGSRVGVAYRLKFGARAELGADGDYLLPFGDFGQSRAHSALTLTSTMSRALALKLSHQLSYVKEPVPGKKNTDTELLASIVARWPPP